MTNAVPTKPRTLRRAAAICTITFARSDWRTWFAACLVPIKVYVALAFLLIIKWKLDLPGNDSPDWFVKSNGLQYVAHLVAIGYFICVILLGGGGLVQFCMRRYRAATTTIIFAIVAFIIGICLGSFALGIQNQRLEFLRRPIL